MTLQMCVKIASQDQIKGIKLSKDGTWNRDTGLSGQDPRVLMELAVTLHHGTAQGAILRLVVEIASSTV